MNRQQDPQEARASVYLYIGDAVIDAHTATFIPDGLTPQQLVAIEHGIAQIAEELEHLLNSDPEQEPDRPHSFVDEEGNVLEPGRTDPRHAVAFLRAAAMGAIPGLIITPTVQQKKT